MFNINDFKSTSAKTSRYERRISNLLEQKLDTTSIEKAVLSAINNIKDNKSNSFVIYGEPQSGKTEMMIALTARLLDEGHKILIVLLNDNVQLLNQNLERFKRSDIDPSPKNFNEILDPSIHIGENEWVIFCKKNSKDLQKLIYKLDGHEKKVIIDDEADYATPNSKINKGEQTKINELVGILLGQSGIYIGVTATPARLDLNNTFKNQSERWLDFLPNPGYTGQNTFFPIDYIGIKSISYNLNLLSDEGDDPKHLRKAMFDFFINVAQININNSSEENFSMLIHTSGKKVDHSEDYKQVIKVLNILKDSNNKYFNDYVKHIWELASIKYVGEENIITKYIVGNISRNDVVVMNSDTDRNVVDYESAMTPASLFTIVIGGNIISRGVTFNNLLSMFFTRDVKHKIQQDTYIQRARMFGYREKYLQYFDLHIPEKLYLDWLRCFVFHRLSLSSIKAGKGAPVWLEDNRVSAVAPSSIDKTTVDMNSGEMGFSIFNFNDSLNDILKNDTIPNYEKLIKISELIGENYLPSFLLSFINAFIPFGDNSIAIHGIRLASDDYAKTLDRPRGVLGGEDFKKFPEAIHHILIYKNNEGMARIIYAYKGNIKTLKNRGKK